MLVERREEIEAVFEAALEQPPAGRRAWLAARCAGDPALLAEVQSLVDASDRAGGILDGNVAVLASAVAERTFASRAFGEDRFIGPYRVIRELGRGGMGVVYLAERADGEFRRHVAIKLLRASPDADELHRRFRAERQILASLNHPNIAQLLDGGTTDGQLPYLVMEYVDGLPITEWCERERLDVEARLRLFEDVCAAVQTAHQSLVIHRDLKPGNILVTADGQVKLLDFGIAKLLGAREGVDLPHTHAGLRVMTPEYASPEQVRGEPLSTASDVYSLGVVLYELLAGRRPYELQTAAPRELFEYVCEREPDRPSVAAARAGAPERVQRRLRGDVDAIVMKALRKEPRRRYGSAELLRDDLQRLRDGLPVSAHVGTRAYRLAKFLGRHRVAVATSAVVLLSLGVGTGVATYQARLAARQRDAAEAALLQSEQMGDFLVGLFDMSSPTLGRTPAGDLADVVARAEGQIAQLDRQPLAQATMLDAMGRVQLGLGRYREARAVLERALALRRRHGAGDAELATTLLHLADVVRRLGEYARATEMAEEALARRRAALGDRHTSVADALDQLRSLAIYRGDLVASEEYAREALAVREEAPVRDARRIGYAMQLLASPISRRGRTAEAEELLRGSVELYEREVGPDEPEAAAALLRLADLQLRHRERLDLARESVERAVSMLTRAYGSEHPQIVWALNSLADIRSREGRHEEAIAINERALAIRERAFGPVHPVVADAIFALAASHRAARHWAEAERIHRRGMATLEQNVGRESSGYAGATGMLGDMALEQGRIDEADSLFRDSHARYQRTMPENRNAMALPVARLGELAARRGQVALADSLYRDALGRLEPTVGPGHHDTRRVLRLLAALHEAHGDVRQAEAYRRRVEASLVK